MTCFERRLNVGYLKFVVVVVVVVGGGFKAFRRKELRVHREPPVVEALQPLAARIWPTTWGTSQIGQVVGDLPSLKLTNLCIYIYICIP